MKSHRARFTLSLAALIAAAKLLSAAQAPDQPAFKNTALPINERVDDLVGRMTLAEKVSQMQNHSVAIERLGIPEYDWWNEGLHGVARSGYATVFPQSIGMAATWDVELLHRIGDVISTEARAKYNEAIRQGIHSIYFGLTFWSPNINIFRDPRWGRGQETYGEDPYLTSRLGVAFVTGLQGTDPKYLKVVATPKHFAVHSGPESERHRFNVSPSPADLEGTYLPAFRATVTEGQADSVMCAYNAVDGVPACASAGLLAKTLRGDWHFNGYVTSDCGAVSDFFSKHGHKFSPDRAHGAASALRAGTDTSCGDEYAALTQAVQEGLVTQVEIDTAVKRLFTARFRLGMFDRPSTVPYAQIPFSENDSPAHRAVALEAARKSMVLLKNENGILPLRDGIKRIAVVGPNAASLASLEGNYNGVPSEPILPVDGMEKEFRGRAKIIFAQGATYAEGVSLPVPRTAFHPSQDNPEFGLKAEYFGNSDLAGDPAAVRVDRQIDFDWNAARPLQQISANDFGVRWTGTITVPKEGDYAFDVTFAHCWPCSDREKYALYIDGQQVTSLTTDESKPYHSDNNPPFQFHFADTRAHTFRVEYSHHSKLFGAGLTLNWKPPADSLLPQAVDAARSSDVVIAFVGLSPDLEGEEMPVHVEGFAGGDRTDIGLPAAQQQLLEALAGTGKPLIVVLMNGSALAVNWAQGHAAAILEAWYGGEAGGQAIAETLSGSNNPAGRLPVTFYSSLNQLPSFDDYSMTSRTYRFFEGHPLYRFGFGLSYTSFNYSQIESSAKNVQATNNVTISASVRNNGPVKGEEVVQLYLTAPRKPGAPRYSLRAFSRISLAAGESRRVQFELSPRQFSEVAANGTRSVEPGVYQVSIGGGQPLPGFNGTSTSFSVSGQTVIPQ